MKPGRTRAPETLNLKHESTAGDRQGSLEDYLAAMGANARAAGEDGARRSDPDGHDEALRIIEELASTGEPFQASDVRAMQRVGSPACLGGAFGAARRLGIIRVDGYEPARSVSRHQSVTRRWVGAT